MLGEKWTSDLYGDCFHFLFIISTYSLLTVVRSNRNIRVCSLFA